MTSSCENEQKNLPSNEYLIEKWNYWVNVLNRIKQDEQNWISNLLLIFGAIFYFIIEKLELCIGGEELKIILFIVVIGVAIFWGNHSLNLRRQYYRAMLQSKIIENQLYDTIDNNWVELNFDKWRDIVTKPKEGKLSEIILLSGCVIISGLLAFYKETKTVDAVCFTYIMLSMYILFGVLLLMLFNKIDKNKLLTINDKRINWISEIKKNLTNASTL